MVYQSLIEIEMESLSMRWRHSIQHRESVDLLRVYMEAHRNITFPADCVGMTVGSVDLEAAVRDIHSLVAAYLASDHREHFLDAVALHKMVVYRVAFETAIRRGARGHDYFHRTIDIIDRLVSLQFKQR